MTTISLKLLVDKERNRVVFAESDKYFVDILFSFLTLPIGTVIRLLDKQSSVGCMDKIYESVENLDVKYFETEACKTMLLQPRSVAEQLCEDLLINPEDLKPRRIYRCPSNDCFTRIHQLYSSISGARCGCGKALDVDFVWRPTGADAKDGVFLKGETAFVISDDLHVEPATIAATLSLFQKFGIKDAETLEKQIVNVRREEVLILLKMLLQSKMPLTNVFLHKPEEHELVETVQIKLEDEKEDAQLNTVNVKVLLDKLTNKVIYAEAGDNFVDIILSFLTFPLGSIAKLLHENSSIGCVDNLYKSVQVLGVGNSSIKSKEYMSMLLAPMLSPHFNCDNQILKIGANLSKSCQNYIDHENLTEINPKLPIPGTGYGGGFAKKSVRFLVSSDMVISSQSSISGLELIWKFKSPLTSLIVEEFTLGEAEVLNLLRACLASRTPLDDILQLKKRRGSNVSMAMAFNI